MPQSEGFWAVQAEQGLWVSVLLSSLAGLLCVTFVVVTFLFIRSRHPVISLIPAFLTCRVGNEFLS